MSLRKRFVSEIFDAESSTVTDKGLAILGNLLSKKRKATTRDGIELQRSSGEKSKKGGSYSPSKSKKGRFLPASVRAIEEHSFFPA